MSFLASVLHFFFFVVSLFLEVSGTSELCQRAIDVSAGRLNLSDGLHGLVLHVGTGIFDPTFLSRNAESGQLSGLEVDLYNHIASRGNFKISYEFYQKPDNISWSDVLFDMGSKYDLVTYGYWHLTDHRAMRGLISPFPYLDMSYRLITVQRADKEEGVWQRMFVFLKPFEPEVWWCSVVLLAVTALTYLMLEGGNAGEFPQGLHISTLVSSFLKAFQEFTGSGEGLSPSTWAGQLLRVSWSWFIVLFMACYTASLASHFMIINKVTVDFESIEGVMQAQATLCYEKGAVSQWFESSPYASYRQVEVFPEADIPGSEMSLALFDKTCDALILPKYNWDRHIKSDPLINKGCRLRIAGPPLHSMHGGWMAAADYSVRCTSLVRDVVNYYFLALSADGTLQQLVARHVEGVNSCAQASVSPEDSSDRLRMSDMMGTYLIHISVTVLAIVLHYMRLGWRRWVSQHETSSSNKTGHLHLSTAERRLHLKLENLEEYLQSQMTMVLQLSQTGSRPAETWLNPQSDDLHLSIAERRLHLKLENLQENLQSQMSMMFDFSQNGSRPAGTVLNPQNNGMQPATQSTNLTL